jgi:sucrose phosphorylase
MPGIPQIWYLDLFVGRNDHDAVLKAGPDGHKEINRTNLSMKRALALVEQKIVRDQLELIRIRNTHAAFLGQAEFIQSKQHEVSIFWKHQNDFTHLRADLNTKSFEIEFSENLNSKILRF